MIDGGSSPDFEQLIGQNITKLLHETDGKKYHLFWQLSKYAGQFRKVDAIQIFDSWNALCPDKYLNEWSLDWINQISLEVSNKVPIILYAKTPSGRLHLFSNCKVSGISLDHKNKAFRCKKNTSI